MDEVEHTRVEGIASVSGAESSQAGVTIGPRDRRAPPSTVTVTAESIAIRIPRPDSTAADSRDERAGLLSFAARVDSFEGLVLWHRYEAAHAVLASRIADCEAQAHDTADVYTRVYDPVARTAASYAAVAGVTQFTAELFLDLAVACMERIPRIGALLREGRFRPGWFREAVTQTALVEDAAVLDVIDAEAAHHFRTCGALTRELVRRTMVRIVAEHDADAARETREAAKRRKGIRVDPLDSGLADLVITADAVDVTLATEVLDAVIAGVCPNDRRSTSQRRSDAAMARINGAAFVCACEDSESCTATLAPADVAQRCAGIVLHVVARRESLSGESETPAFLDGHGPISADHARDLAARPETARRDLDLGDLLDGGAQTADPHRPTATCEVAVRAVFGQCSWPGCRRAAWKSDLDHVCEFDRARPEDGGHTCHCNLNPKCRFHHGLKTHDTGWLDDQIVDAHGVIWTEVVTPEGHVIRGMAPNTWLIPELGSIPCRHGPARAVAARTAGDEPRRPMTRTQARHRYRMAMRAANRRAREQRRAAEDQEPAPPY